MSEPVMVATMDWQEFGTKLAFIIGVAILLFVLFSLLNSTQFFRRLFATRGFIGDDDAPQKPDNNVFSWLIPVWNASEADIIRCAGLDAAVFLRMFIFSIQVLAALHVVCLPILLPLNTTDDKFNISLSSNSTSEGIAEASTSNLSPGSDRLWGTFAVLHVMTFITCGLMWSTYRHMWELRHEFLAQRARKQHPEEYTVLLTDIPSAGNRNSSSGSSASERDDEVTSPTSRWSGQAIQVLRAATLGLVRESKYGRGGKGTKTGAQEQSQQVTQFFTQLYGDYYLTNQAVLPIGKVQGAYNRWKTAKRNLQRAVWAHQSLASKKQAAEEEAGSSEEEVGKFTFLPCCRRNSSHDRVDYWLKKVEKLSGKLKEQQESDVLHRKTGSAFVSFRSRRVTAVAVQTEHAMKGSRWRVHMAPEPDDVIWRNVELKLWENNMRSHVGLILTILLIIFFYIPVTFVAGLTSIENLMKVLPFLKQYAAEDWFNGFLASFLPSLGLRIILWIVPPVFMLLARLEGCVSFSEAQRTAAAKHFYVLLFNVFLGYTFTGTLLSQLQAIIDHPSELVTILASSIPQTFSFFITYTVVSSLMFFIELFRFPIQFVRYLYIHCCVGKETADKEHLWNQGGIAYHIFVPYQNLVITFAFVFAVIAPLILPFVLIYSFIGYVVWKHQVLFVYSYPFQSGGLLWPHFVDHVFVALSIAQLTAIGEFGLKKAFYQAGWTVPLFISTLYFWVMLKNQYGSSFRVLPLELACAVDNENSKAGTEPTPQYFLNKYTPICLHDWEDDDYRELMKEAKTCLSPSKRLLVSQSLKALEETKTLEEG